MLNGSMLNIRCLLAQGTCPSGPCSTQSSREVCRYTAKLRVAHQVMSMLLHSDKLRSLNEPIRIAYRHIAYRLQVHDLIRPKGVVKPDQCFQSQDLIISSLMSSRVCSILIMLIECMIVWRKSIREILTIG